MDLNEIISSLSEDDINQLKNVAGTIFGSDNQHESDQSSQKKESDIFQSIGEIGKLFSLEDERTLLIKALKPMLSEDKQKKADEAIKILRLMQIVPLLRDSGLFKGLF